MFLRRRMPVRARSFCRIFLTVIPDFMNRSALDLNYAKMVEEIKETALRDIKKEYPTIRQISKSKIADTKNVIAVRCFAGKDDDFYVVYGYEAYLKMNKNGSKWLITADDNVRAVKIKSEERTIPDLKIWYCGCCGDVNILTSIDSSQIFYLTFD